METIADFEKWIGTMRSELGQQVVAVNQLTVVFAESDTQLVRQDQVALLRILKTRFMAEVENIKRIESAAQSGADTRALLGGGVAFTLGSLFMAGIGRKDAADVGVNLAISTLSKTLPFGTVLIAAGKGGLPDDLKIVPLSRLARESNSSESEVETNLKYGGYLLMTPDAFSKVLDKVECGILSGSYSLPMVVDEIINQIA